MAIDVETLAVSKKYTKDTVAGAGALAGVPCQIQSVTNITGGKRVTFLWEDNDGTSHTTTMDVMNGADGQDGEDGKDGKGIQSVSVNENNHLIITYSDGTTTDAGQIEIHSAVDSVNGKTGAVVLDASDVGALPANTPIPSKTSNLTNDSGFITKAVNDLVSYYLKSETYSKTQVDDIVTAVKNSRFEVVATLPTTDIKTNVIYLVPKSPSQTNNVKDEYINLDGTSAGWEKIGDTEIDLSDYVTTQALNTALANYTTTADLTTLLAAKQDTLTFDNAPTKNSNNPVKSGGVYSANQNIYEVMGANGAKNLLPNIGASNTINGITYTVNEDGSVTADGTATSNSEFILIQHDSDIATEFKQNIIGKTLTLSGCPDGGGSSKYHVRKWGQSSSGTYYDQGNGVTFTPTLEEYDSYTWNFQIRIMSGTTVSNLLFKPMLRLASDTDNTYQPYAKTNKQLTEDKAEQAEVNDIVNVYGAKNLLRYPFNDGTKVTNGITYTDNGDGTVTANGTASGGNAIFIIDGVSTTANMLKPNTTYRFSAGDFTGSTSTLWVRIYIYNTAMEIAHTINLIGEEIVYTTPNDLKGINAQIVILNGQTVSNLVFKPMIRLASIEDDTWQPYAKTNHQLTEDTTALLDNLEVNGAVNMLPNNATSQVVNGITFTVNDDGSVTANGTSTAFTSLVIAQHGQASFFDDFIGKPIKLSGCPSGGASNTYKLRFDYASGNYVDDVGEGVIITPTAGNSNTWYVEIGISGGVTVSNLTFKPMLTVPSYNGDYVPYAKTNRELTDDVASIEGNYVIKAFNSSVNVTADGTKTYKTLLNELANTFLSACQSLGSGEIAEVIKINDEATLSSNPTTNNSVLANNTTGINVSFGKCSAASDSSAFIQSITVHTTLNSCYMGKTNVTSSGNTFTDYLSTVPASGKKIILYYRVLKLL